MAEHILGQRAFSLWRQVPEHRKHTRLWRVVCLLSQALGKMLYVVYLISSQTDYSHLRKVTWIHEPQHWASLCYARGNIDGEEESVPHLQKNQMFSLAVPSHWVQDPNLLCSQETSEGWGQPFLPLASRLPCGDVRIKHCCSHWLPSRKAPKFTSEERWL